MLDWWNALSQDNQIKFVDFAYLRTNVHSTLKGVLRFVS